MICPCVDLVNTLRDLIIVVDTLCDELRQARLKRQQDIEALIELHSRTRKANTEAEKVIHESINCS